MRLLDGGLARHSKIRWARIVVGVLLAGSAFGQSTSTLSLTPSSLSFPSQRLTTTSLIRVAVLANPGTATAANLQIAASGDFAVTNTCGSSLAAKSTCVLSVKFSPTAIGLRTGSINISSSAGAVTLSLQGLGYTLTSVSLVPRVSSIAAGTKLALSARGVFSDGSAQNVDFASAWASSMPSVATVSSGGVVTALSPGSTVISVRAGAATGNAAITVTSATLAALGIRTASASLPQGVKQQFLLTGVFNDGTAQDLTQFGTWHSSNPAVATVSAAGIVASLSAGTSTLSASFGGLSTKRVVTVTGVSLQSIGITPSSPVLAFTTTIPLQATGAFSDGSSRNITNSVTWTSSQPSLVSVSSLGMLAGLGVTQASITATAGAISASVPVTVKVESFTSLQVRPVSASLAVGQSRFFRATAAVKGGGTQDVTDTVHWSSSAPTVAEVVNTIGAQGLANAVSVGSANIQVDLGPALVADAPLTVNTAVLNGIVVTPVNPTVTLGLTQQFVATGNYSDHSTQDLTTSVVWSSSNQSIASVSNAAGTQGLVATISSGTAFLTATLGTIHGSSAVSVAPAALTSMTVAPVNPSAPVGQTQQFTASGLFTDGSIQNLTSTATWSSSNTGIAAISNTAGSQGLATTLTPGSTTISATSGAIGNSTLLTVVNAGKQLISISVSPPSATVGAGGTQQFTASGGFSDGSSQDVTTQAIWAAAPPSIATISNAAGSQGLATGIGQGTASISAVIGSISSLGSLIVNAPPTINITSPSNLSFLNLAPTTVNGTVSDPNATVAVNGIAAPNSNGSFSVSVPLTEGNNTLTATATSANGLTGTASILVTLDTVPPRVTINSPVNGFSTTAGAVDVAGIVNDIVVGTVNSQQVTVTVNNAQAQVANRTFLAPAIPLSAGVNTISAVGTDRAGNSYTTSITVTRNAPSQQARIQSISGNGQSGIIGAQLPNPLLVSVTDSTGQPVAGVNVIFKITQNNGMLVSGAQAAAPTLIVPTNAQGQAQAQWTLGFRSGAGSDMAQAYAVGYAGTALFTASASQGNAAAIVVDSGNAQVGEVNQTLPKPLIAVVTDAGFNRLANVPVTFTVSQGGGNIGGQQSITVNSDSDGRVAATLTLGLQEGTANNLVQANFPGNTGFSASFTASGMAAGPAANTTIGGVVLDNTNNPIPGVTLRAILTGLYVQNPGSLSTASSVQTNAQGQFSLTSAPVGDVKLFIDGSTAQKAGTYPSLEYDMVTISGQNNTVGLPIYLLPLNPVNQLCVTETTGGGTLTMPEAPGFSLTFGPGQVTFPGGSKQGCVSVTVVHGDKVPMVPGFGQQPRFIVTIQPSGALFSPPAPITLPNVDGLAPRAVTEMYSFDHDLSSFVAIGTGTVSDDGQVIRSNNGVGVLKAGWHCGGNPQTAGTAADCGACQICDGVSCVPDPAQAGTSCPNACIVGGSGTCTGGICSGSPINCDDGDLCDGIETCDPISGCQAGMKASNGSGCGACMTGGSCMNGSCVGGTPIDCNDGLICNGVEACSSGTGCQNGTPPPVGTNCGACFLGGACDGHGSCLGGSPAPSGTPCTSTDPCTVGGSATCGASGQCLGAKVSIESLQAAVEGVKATVQPVGRSLMFTGAVVAPGCQGLSYFWDFGDNTQSSLPSPQHFYVTPQEYLVTLTVHCGSCASASDTAMVTIAQVSIAKMWSDQLNDDAANNYYPGGTGSIGDFILMGARSDGYAYAKAAITLQPSTPDLISQLLVRFQDLASPLTSEGSAVIASAGQQLIASIQTPSLSFSTGHDYAIIAGFDHDGDRQLDVSETFATSIVNRFDAGHFTVIPNFAYSLAKDTLYAAAFAASKGGAACGLVSQKTLLSCPVAASFLLSFATGTPPTDALPTILQINANASGEVLHHNVGVAFVAGAPIVPQYTFPSRGQVETAVRSSSALTNILIQSLQTSARYTEVFGYFQNHPDMSHTFGPWEVSTNAIHFDQAVDFDLGISFLDATLQNIAISVTVTRQQNELLATAATINAGTLMDLYDFNYTDSSFLAQLGAEVQAGYPTLGVAGMVFAESVELNGLVPTFSYDFGTIP